MGRKHSLIAPDEKKKVEVWLYPKDLLHLGELLDSKDYTDMSDAIRDALKIAADIKRATRIKPPGDRAASTG